MLDDVSKLVQLGSQKTSYPLDHPSSEILETFPNQFPHRNYVIVHHFPEFTSLCPKTGQPDFAEMTIRYVAGGSCLESKSLKLYYFSYRNEGTFMETLVNRVLEDAVKVCSPQWMEVSGVFRARGGVQTTVRASHGEESLSYGYTPNHA